jgi:signal peptidase II|tara:strand:- start:60 stop:566 length:507 start_codon:yes stop_codon:yes gene_type:complete
MSIPEKLHKKNFLLFIEKYNLICFFLIIIFFIFDRITKIKIIESQLINNQVYINDFINFELIWNTGIGFGLLSYNTSLIYNSITALIGFVIIFMIYLLIKSSLIEKFFFSLVIGGALGNFYDRLIFYAVPDFIDIHYKSFHWFTFNLADIFITIGIIMLLSKELINKK